MLGKRKGIWLLLSAAMAMTAVAVSNLGVNAGYQIGNEAKAAHEDPTRYIGYGYNPASGVPLADTRNALYLSNPILDVNNEETFAKLKIKSDITATSGYSINEKSSSTTQIAEKIGNALSVGVTGKVKMVSTKLGTTFDMKHSLSSVKQQEFTYYAKVINRRSVVIQTPESSLKECLNPLFLQEAKTIKSVDDAKNFLTKYGAYLLSGYTLGGILEITNYYASSSETAARASNVDIEEALDVSVQNAYEFGQGFSFTKEYEAEDNNGTTTNQYDANHYGGHSFPDMSIEDVFDYQGGITSNENLNYNIWIKSINEEESLAIVGVPQQSRMIGVWELLPDKEEYKVAKPNLISAYVSMCADAVKNYQYSDLVQKISIPEAASPNIELNGYETFDDLSDTHNYSRVFSHYTERRNSDTGIISLRPGTIISLDYNSNAFNGYDIEWIIKEGTTEYIDKEHKDKRNPIFYMPEKDKMDGDKYFTIEARSNGVKLPGFGITINVKKDSIFSAGDGTENNPYIIASPRDLIAVIENNNPNIDYYDKDKYYRLINDLDFTGIRLPKPLGNDNTNFNGHIDGEGFALKNLSFDENNITTLGSHNGGFIGVLGGNGWVKNITFEDPTIKYDFTVNPPSNTTPAKEVSVVGVVAGYTNAGSKIENVVVKNPKIEINRGDYTYHSKIVWPSGGELLVGGAIGWNQGTIEHLVVLNGDIKAMVGAAGNRQCSVGGAIGLNGFPADANKDAGLIKNIKIKNVSVYGSLENGNDCYSMVGGVIGCAVDLNADHILVEENDGIRIQSKGNCLKFAGGVFGYLDNYSNSNKATLEYAEVKGGTNFLESQEDRIGYIGGSKNPNAILYTNNILWDNSHQEGWKAIGVYEYSNSGDKVIIDDDPIYANVSFNEFANVKKDFYKGETFSASGLEVVCDEKPVSDYWLDYSRYNKDIPGSYEIFVSYKSQKGSYMVTVHDASVVAINVELKDNIIEHYEGELLSVKDFSFKKLNLDGTEEEIDLNNKNVIVDLVNANDGRLQRGDNKFSFIVTIGGDNYSDELVKQVVVNAKERTYSGIEWTGIEPTANGYTNTPVYSGNLLKNSSFVVNYEEGVKTEYTFDTDAMVTETTYDVNGNAHESKKLSRSEANIEVIVPALSVGDNNALLCYDDYNTLGFNIVGEKDPNDHTDEYDIVRTHISNIEKAKNISERFVAINNANAYVNSLSWSDDTLNELVDIINGYVVQYNADVARINNDVNENIEISLATNGVYFQGKSMLALSIMLAVLFVI